MAIFIFSYFIGNLFQSRFIIAVLDVTPNEIIGILPAVFYLCINSSYTQKIETSTLISSFIIGGEDKYVTRLACKIFSVIKGFLENFSV